MPQNKLSRPFPKLGLVSPASDGARRGQRKIESAIVSAIDQSRIAFLIDVLISGNYSCNALQSTHFWLVLYLKVVSSSSSIVEQTLGPPRTILASGISAWLAINSHRHLHQIRSYLSRSGFEVSLPHYVEKETYPLSGYDSRDICHTTSTCSHCLRIPVHACDGAILSTHFSALTATYKHATVQLFLSHLIIRQTSQTNIN